LRDALARSLTAGTTTIIEVRTDRVANRELHRTLEAAALAALASPPDQQALRVSRTGPGAAPRA
jgi:hypothetical protein